jgi:hypothetical protein
LKGWEHSGSKQKPQKIAEKTKTKDLVDVTEKGYLAWAILSVDDPDAKLTFEADDKPLSETILTARDLFALGLTAPNPMGLFCPTFDTINENFIIMYMPLTPLPYSESLKVTLKQEKQILTLRSFEISTVKIVDEALFKEGLKDLSGSTQAVPKGP